MRLSYGAGRGGAGRSGKGWVVGARLAARGIRFCCCLQGPTKLLRCSSWQIMAGGISCLVSPCPSPCPPTHNPAPSALLSRQAWQGREAVTQAPTCSLTYSTSRWPGCSRLQPRAPPQAWQACRHSLQTPAGRGGVGGGAAAAQAVPSGGFWSSSTSRGN